MSELRPNKAELQFLNLAYPRFYGIVEEVRSDDFWKKDPKYRFSVITAAFAIYTEILNYEPIGWEIERLRKERPPMEAEMGSELVRLVRNILAHFPFFETWDSVWITKDLVNWSKEGMSIDRFLDKYTGRDSVKYRIWDGKEKKMTYVSINFPLTYEGETKIFLKDILNEKEGVWSTLILMAKIVDTTVEYSSD